MRYKKNTVTVIIPVENYISNTLQLGFVFYMDMEDLLWKFIKAERNWKLDPPFTNH